MATHAVLEALGIDYHLVEIDLSKGEQKSAGYLAINPNGKVPTLVHDKYVIYESAAILLYLLDQHPESSLAPPIQNAKRGHYYQYMFWMSNTLQEAANRWAHPEYYLADESAKHQIGHVGDRQSNLDLIVEKATQELMRCWGVLEADLAKKGPWLLGDILSGADYHLFMLTYWSRRYGSRAQDYPYLNAHIRAMLNLESIQVMMQQEALEFDL
ncbi:MAG: glutathione S-transferase [Oceanospirillaceae bacterium]|jgi:glutathione S-transferase